MCKSHSVLPIAHQHTDQETEQLTACPCLGVFIKKVFGHFPEAEENRAPDGLRPKHWKHFLLLYDDLTDVFRMANWKLQTYPTATGACSHSLAAVVKKRTSEIKLWVYTYIGKRLATITNTFRRLSIIDLRFTLSNLWGVSDAQDAPWIARTLVFRWFGVMITYALHIL